MTSPLRIGFLVSGLLHLAVVAAFSLPPMSSVGNNAGEPEPIRLTLAMFEPAPVPDRPQVEPSPEPESPPPPEPGLTEAPPEPESLPQPLTEPETRMPLAEPEPEPRIGPKPASPPEPPPVQQRPPKPMKPVKPERVVRRTSAEQPRPRPVPPAVAPITVAEPAVPVVDPLAKQHYLAALAARIDRSKFYPRASRRLGEEGMAVVGFVIRRNGELTDIHIVESSGHRRLDEAALKTLQRVTPFERIPEAIEREQWPITVPIAFSLRG